MSKSSELDDFRIKWREEVADKETSQKKIPPSKDQPQSGESSRRVESSGDRPFVLPSERNQALDPYSRPSKSPSVYSANSVAGDIYSGPVFEKRVCTPSSKTKPGDPVLKTALHVYELAIERERQGALSEALVLYRQAFRMDADIDKGYKTAFLAGETKDSHDSIGTHIEDNNYAKFIQTAPDYDPLKESETSMTDLINMFVDLRLPMTPALPTKYCGIYLLPNEILVSILTYVILDDPSNLVAVSLTCQKLLLSSLESSIWKLLCYKTYAKQICLPYGVPPDTIASRTYATQQLNHELVSTWASSWKSMFIQKPQIRFNGIYIATCHYLRPGMREASLVWTAPVQLVTYFRYIRFFDNGQCLSLLTTMEPREVVHAVYRGTKLGGVQCGRWNLEEQGALHVTTRGPADYMFHMDLKVKSSGRGRLNKLAWSRFWGIHPFSDEVTEFNLKNDKSYFFSRVRSYIDTSD